MLTWKNEKFEKDILERFEKLEKKGEQTQRLCDDTSRHLCLVELYQWACQKSKDAYVLSMSLYGPEGVLWDFVGMGKDPLPPHDNFTLQRKVTSEDLLKLGYVLVKEKKHLGRTFRAYIPLSDLEYTPDPIPSPDDEL